MKYKFKKDIQLIYLIILNCVIVCLLLLGASIYQLMLERSLDSWLSLIVWGIMSAISLEYYNFFLITATKLKILKYYKND